MSIFSTRKSSKTKSQDVTWEHKKPLDECTNRAKCKYCGQKMKFGGVKKLKKHLAGGYKNVKNCPKISPKVIKLMKRVLSIGMNFRESRKQHERNISEKLYGFPNIVDVDEEEEKEYEEDMRRVLYASRAEAMEE